MSSISMYIIYNIYYISSFLGSVPVIYSTSSLAASSHEVPDHPQGENFPLCLQLLEAFFLGPIIESQWPIERNHFTKNIIQLRVGSLRVICGDEFLSWALTKPCFHFSPLRPSCGEEESSEFAGKLCVLVVANKLSCQAQSSREATSCVLKALMAWKVWSRNSWEEQKNSIRILS